MNFPKACYFRDMDRILSGLTILIISLFLVSSVFSADISKFGREDEYRNLKVFLMDKELENVLVEDLCRTYGNYGVSSPFDGNNGKPKIIYLCEDQDKNLILSSRVCVGASTELLGHLKRHFTQINFEHVWTRDFWPQGFYHVFIKVRDFFGWGRDLIIDPTYTQFIAHNENIKSVEKEHRIFVGSYEELRAIHARYGFHESNVDNYLSTRPWSGRDASIWGYSELESPRNTNFSVLNP